MVQQNNGLAWNSLQVQWHWVIGLIDSSCLVQWYLALGYWLLCFTIHLSRFFLLQVLWSCWACHASNDFNMWCMASGFDIGLLVVLVKPSVECPMDNLPNSKPTEYPLYAYCRAMFHKLPHAGFMLDGLAEQGKIGLKWLEICLMSCCFP